VRGKDATRGLGNRNCDNQSGALKACKYKRPARLISSHIRALRKLTGFRSSGIPFIAYILRHAVIETLAQPKLALCPPNFVVRLPVGAIPSAIGVSQS
jgi:hypothetical protein